MQELIKRNYASIVKRGYITPETTGKQFFDKVEEEVNEVFDEYILHKKGKPNNLGEELADVILTCLNYAHHFNINIENEIISKIKKNELRKD